MTVDHDGRIRMGLLQPLCPWPGSVGLKDQYSVALRQ